MHLATIVAFNLLYKKIQIIHGWGLELGPNEIDLVGVVSNELGAKGLASPAVLGKAVEEGATILNAFAVKSAKYKDGKLPEIYEQYGFRPIKNYCI
jgi:hypothetical protein